MAENSPNLMNDININIQEAQQTPCRINSETHIEIYYNENTERQRQNLKSSKRSNSSYTRDPQ